MFNDINELTASGLQAYCHNARRHIMTKKDYIAIAEILQDAEPQEPNDLRLHSYWALICLDLGKYVAKDNPRFNKQIFYNACYSVK